MDGCYDCAHIGYSCATCNKPTCIPHYIKTGGVKYCIRCWYMQISHIYYDYQYCFKDGNKWFTRGH